MEDKQMTFEEKTKEYREQITSLKEIDSLEVYQWLISCLLYTSPSPRD